MRGALARRRPDATEQAALMRANEFRRTGFVVGCRESLDCVRPTSVAELRAGHPCRPYRGALDAATDEASEGARCGRRAAMKLTFPVPRNGPRASSSAKLGGVLLRTGKSSLWPRKKT